MDHRELRELNDDLLRAAVKISPNGEVQAAFGKMVNEMREKFESERRIAICLASAIVDGLSFENWPS